MSMLHRELILKLGAERQRIARRRACFDAASRSARP
jgi:hypothetical protein